MDVVLAAGAVVTDGRGRVLLVKRGREPGRGQWSVPGGKTEPGETLAEAAVRETLEETGLHVVIGPELLCASVATGDGRCYEIHDFAGTVSGGVLAAGDDADDAAWFAPDELVGLPLTPELLDHLRRLGVAPGDQTVAAGDQTVAAGDQTVAAGDQTVAAGDQTVAAGDQTGAAGRTASSAARSSDEPS